MSMDWIHLGISGFTKEDTIDESHRFTYDTGTSRVCNDFKWHSHKNVTKFPMNLWQDCSFLTVKSWFACVFWHWIALVNQSQAAPGSNLMRKWSKFHGRNSSPKLESVFGPLQLYLFALAVTGLNWSRCVKMCQDHGWFANVGTVRWTKRKQLEFDNVGQYGASLQTIRYLSIRMRHNDMTFTRFEVRPK